MVLLAGDRNQLDMIIKGNKERDLDMKDCSWNDIFFFSNKGLTL